MDTKTKDFLATTTSGISVRLFTRDPESMGFREQVLVCSALQVIEKYTKDRRKGFRQIIGDRIDAGDTDGVPITRTESGNPKIHVDDVSCYVDVRGGGKKPDIGALRELLAAHEIDPAGTEDQPALIEPVGETVNEAKFFAMLADQAEGATLTVAEIREACVEPKKYEVNEDHIWALTRVGLIDPEDLNACYDEIPERRSVRCTFDRDTKAALLEAIAEGGGAGQIEG